MTKNKLIDVGEQNINDNLCKIRGNILDCWAFLFDKDFRYFDDDDENDEQLEPNYGFFGAKHIDKILAEIKKKYQSDLIVQAILNSDVVALTLAEIDVDKSLNISIKEQGAEIFCQCQYLGLAVTMVIGRLINNDRDNIKILAQIIKVLLDKEANRKSPYQYLAKYNNEITINNSGTVDLLLLPAILKHDIDPDFGPIAYLLLINQK